MRQFHPHGFPIREYGQENTHIRIRFVMNKVHDLPAVTAGRHATDKWKQACLDGEYGRKLTSFHFQTYFIPEANVFQIDFDFLRVEDSVIEGAINLYEDYLMRYGSGCRIKEVVISYGLI